MTKPHASGATWPGHQKDEYWRGIGEVEFGPASGLHAVEEDAGRAEPAHGKDGDAARGLFCKHDFARNVQPFIVGQLDAALASGHDHLEFALHRDAALDEAGGHGREVAEQRRAAAGVRGKQMQGRGLAGPFEEGRARPEAGDPVGLVAEYPHLQA